MDPKEIAALIEQNLAGRSRGHTDGQGHYEATVVCDAFAGKRSLQRHQLVYATLGTRVGREIHAFALQDVHARRMGSQRTAARREDGLRPRGLRRRD